MKASTPVASPMPPSHTLPKVLASPEDTSSSLGTLWSMRRSPFSSAVKVALHLSGRKADEIPFVPLLSYFTFLFRLGLSAIRTKLSAPILRTCSQPPQYIRDSLEIAVYVDTQRDPSRPSLFPPEHAATIANFNDHAAVLNCFMRAVLLTKLSVDTEAAESLFVPRPLRGRFFTKPLIKFAIWMFRRKYSEESKNASREAARNALEETRKALALYEGKHLRYLCGERLTYADIIIAESLFFDLERHGMRAYLYKNDEFADRYPDLIAWARAVRETNYPQLTSIRGLKK